MNFLSGALFGFLKQYSIVCFQCVNVWYVTLNHDHFFEYLE